eukprot:SAG31_NODE_32074_length_360_cov_0.973180_1_plen_109_part_01
MSDHRARSAARDATAVLRPRNTYPAGSGPYPARQSANTSQRSYPQQVLPSTSAPTPTPVPTLPATSQQAQQQPQPQPQQQHLQKLHHPQDPHWEDNLIRKVDKRVTNRV